MTSSFFFSVHLSLRSTQILRAIPQEIFKSFRSTVRYFYLRSMPRPLDFPFSTREVSSAPQADADVSNFDSRPAILDIRRAFHSNKKIDAEEKMMYKYRSCVIQFVRFYNCRRLNHSFNF